MTGGILMRKILHRFNMVEIVLAIGVVAIGVTGVMALLPPSLNANRDVAADAFVEEAASKVSALLNLKYIPEWKNGTDLPFTNSSTQPEPTPGITKGSDVDSNLSDWKISKDNIYKYGITQMLKICASLVNMHSSLPGTYSAMSPL